MIDIDDNMILNDIDLSNNDSKDNDNNVNVNVNVNVSDSDNDNDNDNGISLTTDKYCFCYDSDDDDNDENDVSKLNYIKLRCQCTIHTRCLTKYIKYQIGNYDTSIINIIIIIYLNTIYR